MVFGVMKTTGETRLGSSGGTTAVQDGCALTKFNKTKTIGTSRCPAYSVAVPGTVMKHFLILLLSGLMLAAISGAGMTVGNPGCEHRQNPLGVDVPQPRLRWILDTTERGQVQTAYQVLVASSRAQLKANIGDVWDSGKVAEDWSAAVTYAGQPLDLPHAEADEQERGGEGKQAKDQDAA